MGQRFVFPAERGELPNPEYTGTFDILRCLMIEYDGSFVLNMARVKCIRHDQEDVNIVGAGCVGDEGAETANLVSCPVLAASV